MNKRVIIFNGPSNCGKTVALSAVQSRLYNRGISTITLDMAAPLKKAVHALVGTRDHYDKFDHGDARKGKDEVHPLMFGHTPREMYKHMSKFVDDVLGPNTLPFILCNVLNNAKVDVGIVQCGVVEEAQVIVDAFGKNNVFVLELSREGYDFDDYRQYIGSSLKCQSKRIPNFEGEKQLFYDMCIVTVGKFLGKDLMS